ncbi:hypothetical protein J6590_079115 [Homalodisca vitripennis]|nr:hypothetical protein J6590_079115 [Homalodisca vitripennis]
MSPMFGASQIQFRSSCGLGGDKCGFKNTLADIAVVVRAVRTHLGALNLAAPRSSQPEGDIVYNYCLSSYIIW